MNKNYTAKCEIKTIQFPQNRRKLLKLEIQCGRDFAPKNVLFHFSNRMFNGDNIYFDFDAISSPIADPNDTYTPSAGLGSTSFFIENDQAENILPFDNPDPWSEKKRPEHLERSFSTPEIKNEIQTNVQLQMYQLPMPVSPKPQKKKPMVFQPFSSFDATELTVKALKEHCYNSSRSTYLSW